MKMIKIGNQIWSAENLALTMDKDGNELVLDKDYFYPNGNKENVKDYGLLYTWNAALRVVPKGWHLPNKEEWRKLIKSADYNPKALAATCGWDTCLEVDTIGNDQSTNNSTGFNARPAGNYNSLGFTFLGYGYNAYFWSSTELTSDFALCYYLYYDEVVVGLHCHNKNRGFSVRCIKDE